MTAVLDYGEIMSKKRLTEKKEQNARLVLAILSGKNTEGQPSQEKESSTSDAEDTEAGEESAS